MPGAALRRSDWDEIDARWRSHEERVTEARLAIGQGLQILQPQDTASRAIQNSMARCRVPLHRPPQTRVEIRLTRGDKAEFERRSSAFAVLDGIAVDVIVRRLIPMRFRGNDHQRIQIGLRDMD